MLDFGEGPTTRSSTRGAKSEIFATPMKYVTRAALHKASEYEETKADALRGLPKLAKPNEDNYSKRGQSRSSSVLSEQGRNLSIHSDDEGFGSPTILPSIPSILARPHHQLSQVWSLWYNRGDPSLTWAENQKVVGTMRTAEEFWQLQQLLCPPSSLPAGVDLALFRAGVSPDWEDEANIAGGRWVARREHRQADDVWLNLLLFLIGKHVDMRGELVTGAVVSVRKAGDRLALWISEADNLETVVKVGRLAKERLGLRRQERLRFSIHREEKKRFETGGERNDAILL